MISSKDAEDDHAGMVPPPGKNGTEFCRSMHRARDREIVELSESKMEEAAKETDREREEDEEEMISD